MTRGYVQRLVDDMTRAGASRIRSAHSSAAWSDASCGGSRSAALLCFEVPKDAFGATATAIALFVDGARLPVYLVTQGAEIAAIWPLLLAASIGVVVGTAVGARILGGIAPRTFHRVVGLALLALGAATLVGAIGA